jgi:hypothetical protein
MASQDVLLAQANSCFVDEQYEEALVLYNQAANTTTPSADLLLKRSACNSKLFFITGQPLVFANVCPALFIFPIDFVSTILTLLIIG